MNQVLARKLGLHIGWLSSQTGLSMLSGKCLPYGADPIAMAYGGHQFADRLGEAAPSVGAGKPGSGHWVVGNLLVATTGV